MEKGFAIALTALTAAIIALFGIGTEYAPPALNPGNYPAFQDVHIMVFVGFGFLMSFMHRGGFTATGHAFFVAAYIAAWAILNRGFWHRAIAEDAEWSRIPLTIAELIGADFASAAVLISFGAVLGRVTLSQLLVMALWETIVFSINEVVVLERLHVADVGGSMVIHAFGAYFGIAASLVLEKRGKGRKDVCSKALGSSRVTDVIAMVGTLFLFCFWPSFNSVLAGPLIRDRTVINTYLSIVMSCIGTFLAAVLLDAKGKIGMVEVQNATIAGGVAIGAAADMIVNPFGACIVGFVSGWLSVAGYKFLLPLLEKKIGLRDTCGVHNLHGLPAIFGSVVSAIAAGAIREGSYQGTLTDTFSKAGERSRSSLAGYQMAGIGVSLLFALVGGAIAGFLMSLMPSLPTFFEDAHEYTVEDESIESTAVEVEMVEKKLSVVSGAEKEDVACPTEQPADPKDQEPFEE